MRPRTTILAIAITATAAAAWLAAPALSLTPFVPVAVDFERALPEAERIARADTATAAHAAEGHGHAEARWITPPVAAPHRFDLVGVAGELREVELRVRDEGGAWTEWVTQAEATPIWVDGADEAQVRAPFRPRGNLHFVNVSGDGQGTAATLLNRAREGINSAFISVADGFVAQAEAPKPKMIGRGAWGANAEQGGCRPRGPAEYGAVEGAVIHHTVNANDYTKAEAARVVLGICRFHVNGNGWNDIGYQALVDRFGRIYKGRAGGMRAAVVGAQAIGFNAETTAIASIGTHTGTKLSKRAVKGTIRYLAWKLSVHGIPSGSQKVQLTSGGGAGNRYRAGTVISTPAIMPHRRLGETECPGGALKRQIKKGITAKVDKHLVKMRKRQAAARRARPPRPQAR
jgi:hypothetical protein